MKFLNLPCPSAFRRRAFTLLELLVVISIIAVLAGILLPVAGQVMDKARKTEARALIAGVLTAVKAYQTDYGVYPVDLGPTPPATAVDTTFTSDSASPGTDKGGHNAVLFDVLRALNYKDSPVKPTSSDTASFQSLNSRRVVYFEGKDAKNTAEPRGGFVPSTSTNTKGLKPRDLVDPWGGLYCVRIDTNYSDKIMNPYPASPGKPTYSPKTDTTDSDTTSEDLVLHTPVAVWCPGKDLIYGDKTTGAVTSNSDDVVSWQ